VPKIQLLPAQIQIDVPRGTRLIQAIRDAGMPIASPCGDELLCGKCGIRILVGAVSGEAPIEINAKRRNGVDAELRLACAVRVSEDLTLTADYWGPLRN
jgi:ferredoxin